MKTTKETTKKAPQPAPQPAPKGSTKQVGGQGKPGVLAQPPKFNVTPPSAPGGQREKQAPQQAAKEPKLAPVFRVVFFPQATWTKAKERAGKDGQSVREVMRDALDGALGKLVDDLLRLGIHPTKNAKRVRTAFDAELLARLDQASQKTGLPMIQLLRLSLSRHLL